MKKLLLFTMFIFAVQIHAQDRAFVTAYLVSYPRTAICAVAAPAGWDTVEWLTAAGLVGICAGIYLIDEDISRNVLVNRSHFSKSLCLAGKQFGEGKYILPAIAASIGGGYIFHSEKTTDTGLLCLKSFLLANSATTSLKFLTQRQRPFSGKGKEFWNGNEFGLKRDSFPSGHTTIVWSLAPVLAYQYREEILVAPIVYSIAGLTSYSRVHDNKHWASDVFAGAVIGYLAAELTLNGTPRLQVWPDLDARCINLSWKF